MLITIDTDTLFSEAVLEMTDDIDIAFPLGVALINKYGKQGIYAVMQKMVSYYTATPQISFEQGE